MYLEHLSDMLMLGLTPSSTSLERRIRVMQDGSSARARLLLPGTIGAIGMVIVACSTTPPDGPEINSLDIVAARPDSSVMLDPAIAYDRLGQALENALGGKLENGQLYWLLFNHDWSVKRVDVGPEGRIEVADSIVKAFGPEFKKVNPGPVYSMAASLEKKYPELKTRRAPGAYQGGATFTFGADTVSLYWGRL